MAQAMNTREKALVYMVGDSYILARRSETELVDPQDSTIAIYPHKFMIEQNYPELSSVDLVLHSRGSMTFRKLMEDLRRNFGRKWARVMPSLTVVHLGACDIANEYVAEIPLENMKHYFPNYIEEQIVTWIDIGREFAEAQNKVETYNEYLSHHRWLVVSPPDWGYNFTPKNATTPEDYGKRRCRAVTGLRRQQKRLWLAHKIAMVFPEIETVDRVGVHLTPTLQEDYINQIALAVGSLMCTFCRPTVGQYVEREHEHQNLCSGECSHQAAVH